MMQCNFVTDRSHQVGRRHDAKKLESASIDSVEQLLNSYFRNVQKTTNIEQNALCLRGGDSTFSQKQLSPNPFIWP